VEAAIVYPVLFALLIGLIVVGMGVFHHQQVAWQAREASRWASVRGLTWEKDTDQPSPTKADIRREAVLPLAFCMDASKLDVRVDWIDQVSGTAVDWDSATKSRFSITNAGEPIVNTVRVTVSYDWAPVIPFLGPIRMASVSEFPMGS
jgi:Flp pilus assembly protein TadG